MYHSLQPTALYKRLQHGWRDPLKRQLGLLVALRIIRMFMIAVPVIAVYWNRFGLSLQDIMLLQVIFAVTWALLEMPSGWLADRFGNKPVIIVGSALGAFGYLLFLLAPTYLGFALGEMILAVGASLLSGARDALLYNTLAVHKREGEYQAWQSRLTTWGLVSEAVAAATASLLIVGYGNLNDLPATEPILTIVILAEFLVLSLAVPLACLLTPHDGDRANADSLWTTIHYCFYGNRQLLWFNLMTGTTMASTLTMFWYTQLHWESLEIPLVWFGVLLAGLLTISAIGSYLTTWIDGVLRFRTVFGLIVGATAVLFGLMALLATTRWSFAILWLFWLQRGVTTPLVLSYVQRASSARNRATVLSANTLMSRLVFTPLAPFLGAIVDVWSFATAFTLSAIAFGGVATMSYILWLKALPKK